jgi:hypothetical protein
MEARMRMGKAGTRELTVVEARRWRRAVVVIVLMATVAVASVPAAAEARAVRGPRGLQWVEMSIRAYDFGPCVGTFGEGTGACVVIFDPVVGTDPFVDKFGVLSWVERGPKKFDLEVTAVEDPPLDPTGPVDGQPTLIGSASLETQSYNVQSVKDHPFYISGHSGNYDYPPGESGGDLLLTRDSFFPAWVIHGWLLVQPR